MRLSPRKPAPSPARPRHRLQSPRRSASQYQGAAKAQRPSLMTRNGPDNDPHSVRRILGEVCPVGVSAGRNQVVHIMTSCLRLWCEQVRRLLPTRTVQEPRGGALERRPPRSVLVADPQWTDGVRRPAPVYTFMEFPRRKPTTVIPASAASDTARSDGAETAAKTGRPARSAFWTISKAIRPDTSST